MEKPKIQSTERLLGKFKKLEVPDIEVQESLGRIGTPLAEIGPEKSGKIETTFEDKPLTISYEEPDAEAKMKINDACIMVGIGNILEKYDDWREVTGFTLEQEDGVLDFLKTSPAGYRLFFNPDPNVDHGFVTWPGNNVYVIGNIATLRAMLTVLHEVGHIWDEARLKAAGLERLTDDHLHTVRAEKVRRERAASAFAFAKLRGMTKNPETREDSVNFLKFFALKDYYEQMEKGIEHDEYMGRQVARDFDQASWDMEEAERQFYDDFLKWKKSSMYELWKAHREPMEDWEEYGAWREWLKESGYDYYKDLPDSSE